MNQEIYEKAKEKLNGLSESQYVNTCLDALVCPECGSNLEKKDIPFSFRSLFSDYNERFKCTSCSYDKKFVDLENIGGI